MNGDIRIVDDVPTAFAQLVEQAFSARERADRFSLALSGGSTARPCYELLVDREIDWNVVHVLWGDERLVPLDHADSNYALAKAALLDHIATPAAVHPMAASEGPDEYDDIVRSLEPLDVVHLGMGDDGHTASLFPGSPELSTPAGRLVVDTGDELHPHPRRTFTFEAIDRAQLAVFTVMGEKKREMLARIRSGEDLPAARVAARHVVWLVDQAAAG